MKPGATTWSFASNVCLRRAGKPRRNRGDAPALDADIGAEPCSAGAVDDAPVANEHVELVVRRRSARAETAEERRQCERTSVLHFFTAAAARFVKRRSQTRSSLTLSSLTRPRASRRKRTWPRSLSKPSA